MLPLCLLGVSVGVQGKVWPTFLSLSRLSPWPGRAAFCGTEQQPLTSGSVDISHRKSSPQIRLYVHQSSLPGDRVENSTEGDAPECP